MAAHSELTGDGRGACPAQSDPLRGHSRVTKTTFNWPQLGVRLPQVSMRTVEVNGEPGALCVDDQERLRPACEGRDSERASALSAGATVRAQRAVEEQLEQDEAARGRKPARRRRAAS